MSLRNAHVFSGLLLSFSIYTAIAAQNLKVTLLGTGNPVPAIDRFGPSILVEAGGEKLLFDCGRGASQRLWQLHIPLGAISTVFLTHLHSDHVVGFPDLWLTGWLIAPFGERSRPLQVLGPTGTKELMSNLEKAFQADIRFRIEEGMPPQGITVIASDIAEGLIYQKNSIKVAAFQVAHTKPALGYRVDYGGHSVVFSGDTRRSENLVTFAKGADVVIHEVAWTRPEILSTSELARRIMNLHTNPEEAGSVFQKVKPRLAVYSHIVLFTNNPAVPPPTTTDILQLTRKRYDGPLEIGEDLMSIEIGDHIAVHRSVPLYR